MSKYVEVVSIVKQLDGLFTVTVLYPEDEEQTEITIKDCKLNGYGELVWWKSAPDEEGWDTLSIDFDIADAKFT